MPVLDKKPLDIDQSDRSVRQNQWRLLTAFKRISEIQLNEENEHLEEEVKDLKKDIWRLKNNMGEENPFTIEEDVERVEEELL